MKPVTVATALFSYLVCSMERVRWVRQISSHILPKRFRGGHLLAIMIPRPQAFLVGHKKLTEKRPSINIPKAILFQFIFGFFSGFLYLIAILYGINDFDSLLNSTYLFPLAEIYRQAAGSAAGSVGLVSRVALQAVLCNLSQLPMIHSFNSIEELEVG